MVQTEPAIGPTSRQPDLNLSIDSTYPHTHARAQLVDQLHAKLDQLEAANIATHSSDGPKPSKQAGPWLELTRWHSFFGNTILSDVAALVTLPPPQDSPLSNPANASLHVILDSFDRLVLLAREAIAKDRVNLFD